MRFNSGFKGLMRGTGCAFKFSTGTIPGQSMWDLRCTK